MDRHSWKGEQKTYEQVQRERLGSTEFEAHEAKQAAQAERAERKFAAAGTVEASLREMQHEMNAGNPPNLQPFQAEYYLCQVELARLVISDELRQRLRSLAGRVDKHELATPAPEPYEEHAMGLHE